MPWTADSFRSKHNHGLSGAQAEHAARIANAILKRGESESIAIATANRMVERADGGAVPLAGGGIAGLGHFQAPHTIRPPAVLLRHPHAHGAFNTPGLAIGGSPMGLSGSSADPWWTRQDAREEDYVHPGGLVGGATSGRGDHVATNVLANSYVLPADVVAGLSEGNTLGGAAVIDKMLHSQPFGIQAPRMGGHGGVSIPRAPRPPQPNYSHGGVAGLAAGRVAQGESPVVPVRLSGGEYVIPPDKVAVIGHGDMQLGHDILDAFIKKVRAKTIKEMQKLPGPKKD